MDRPLITFAIVSYNQEPFIREAIEAAFAQTYTPLEVIISDDCSKDRTFEIARQLAAAYSGPHRVRLNRNERTLGIAGQINGIMELSRGALVVGAAGDDVSLPRRTEVLWEAWEQSGRRATSVFSSYTVISGDGSVQGVGGVRGDPVAPQPLRILKGDLGEFLLRKVPVVNGCTHAWSPALFQQFGPLTSNLEDLVLSLRTLAIGELLYVHEPLVKYRRHDSNVSFLAERDDTRSFEHREKRLRWVDEQSVLAYDNMLSDIESLCRRGAMTVAERDSLRAIGGRMRQLYALERQLMDERLCKRLAILARTAGGGELRCALRFAHRALPRALYRRLYLLRTRWEASCRGGSRSH